MEFPIAGFDFFKTHHCETGSMRHIYQFNHYSISEEMLLGLGEGVGFIYWHSRGQIPFIGGRANSGRPGELGLEKTTGNRTGVNVTWFDTNSSHKAEQALLAELEDGRPVLLQVDMGFLPYFNFPQEYHFGGHCIVAAGFDPQERLVAVADRDGEMHPVTLADMAKARGSTFKPFPPHHRQYSLDFSNAHPPIPEDIRLALRHSANAMLFPPITNAGVKGIHKAAQRIPQWPAVLSTEELQAACFNTYIFIDAKGGSGGGIFRYMFSRFLAEVSPLVAEPRLIPLSVDFQQIGDRWQAVALLFKAAGQHETISSDLIEISRKIEEIAQMEETAWSRLAQILQPD
jgi:hypothetical protein